MTDVAISPRGRPGLIPIKTNDMESSPSSHAGNIRYPGGRRLYHVGDGNTAPRVHYGRMKQNRILREICGSADEEENMIDEYPPSFYRESIVATSLNPPKSTKASPLEGRSKYDERGTYIPLYVNPYIYLPVVNVNPYMTPSQYPPLLPMPHMAFPVAPVHPPYPSVGLSPSNARISSNSPHCKKSSRSRHIYVPVGTRRGTGSKIVPVSAPIEEEKLHSVASLSALEKHKCPKIEKELKNTLSRIEENKRQIDKYEEVRGRYERVRRYLHVGLIHSTICSYLGSVDVAIYLIALGVKDSSGRDPQFSNVSLKNQRDMKYLLRTLSAGGHPHSIFLWFLRSVRPLKDRGNIKEFVGLCSDVVNGKFIARFPGVALWMISVSVYCLSILTSVKGKSSTDGKESTRRSRHGPARMKKVWKDARLAVKSPPSMNVLKASLKDCFRIDEKQSPDPIKITDVHILYVGYAMLGYPCGKGGHIQWLNWEEKKTSWIATVYGHPNDNVTFCFSRLLENEANIGILERFLQVSEGKEIGVSVLIDALKRKDAGKAMKMFNAKIRREQQMHVAWGDSLYLIPGDRISAEQQTILFEDALRGVLTHHLSSSDAIQDVITRRDLELIDLAWTVINDEGTRDTIWKHIVTSQWEAGKNVLENSSK